MATGKGINSHKLRNKICIAKEGTLDVGIALSSTEPVKSNEKDEIGNRFIKG